MTEPRLRPNGLTLVTPLIQHMEFTEQKRASTTTINKKSPLDKGFIKPEGRGLALRSISYSKVNTIEDVFHSATSNDRLAMRWYT